MANTIMSAKNSFLEGLIMDFAPDNTQATCLTSALNATLLTFNGNEMSLLNDMGNGRVETARLPEGYIPLGTCEFGDIIYIVSYNPLDKKAQIGCFPSPERNITSDEMSDLGLSLSYLDFLNPSPDGILKKTSVKKVLVETKKLNPGDKYIIYSNQAESISNNSTLLSDYGLKKHDVLPKAVKLHVVSIEDSGKITYLDTTTKWYGDYYIKEGAVKVAGGKTDLDSYRNLVESEWSIFSSKASGKLAILAELETIDSFSCSYSLEGGEISTEGNIEYKNYKLILEPGYDGREGIIVPYVCITNGTFSRPEEVDSNSYDATKSVFYYNSNKEKITYLNASSLEPHSSYGWPFAESIATTDNLYNFKIPYKEIVGKYKTPINSDSFVYNFSVVPTMGIDTANVYGRLDHLKVDLSIDFNKVGTGEVDFTQWKYHNSEETSVLTYSINTYPKPGYEVKFIQMDFYDNQGHVALYILDDKKSYNGVFNEYFGLGGQGSNIRLSRYKIIPTPGSTEWDSTKKPSEQEKTIIYHNAEKLTKEETSDMYDYDYCDRGGDNYYRNDAGTLYFGVLYAVKITVWQANKTTWEPKEFCRWYWTNPMYNEYYYNTKDFNNLNFELVLDSKALFATNPSKYIWQQEEINNLGNDFGDYDHYKTYSANVLHIGRNIGEDNIHMYVQAGLQNNYGCFNLSNNIRDEINDLSQIKTEIFLSQGQISYNISGDQHEFSGESTNVSDPVFLLLESMDIKDGIEADFNYLNTKPINTEEIKISGLKDDFNIIFGNNIESYGSINRNFKPEGTDIITPKLTTTLDKCYYLDDNNKKEIPLSMSAILYNKAYTQNIYSNNISVPVYTPIINSEDDFGNLGLGVVWEDNTADAKYRRGSNDGTVKMGFLTAMNISLHGDDFSGVNFTRNSSLTFTSPAGGDDAQYIMYTGSREINTSSDEEFISKVWAPISDKMGHFFLVYPGGNHGTHGYSITEGLYNFPNINNWYNKHLSYRSTPSSYFVESCYDISRGGQFLSMNGSNIVGFLGIKHNKGFTLFNLAFADYYYGTQEFLQAARSRNSFLEFESFAYHLYLILSNSFHKNKRIDDAYINLRNYVRNKRYEVTLTKNIVIKLSEQDPNVDHNIAMLGMDFIEYRDEILKFISPDIKLQENIQLLTESSNVHLKFIESAINNVLTITVISQPLLFTDTEASAYIQYNGQLIPSINLADDTFYIYQNGKLVQFQNKILKFDIKEVDKNLRHLFSNLLPEMSSDSWKNTTLKLRGVHPPLLQSLTPLQKAYNKFVDLIYEQMLTINVNNYGMSSLYVSTTDINVAKNRIINLALGLLPSIIEGYNKYDLHRYAIERMPNTSESWISGIEWMGSYETYFSVYDRGIGVDYDQGRYVLEVYLHNRMEYEVTYNDATEYSFDTLFNLKRLFDYENNMLTLKPNAVVSNFGIKDDPNGNDTHGAAYSGFIKDVIIDKNFLIV